jgi:hypothetical protein
VVHESPSGRNVVETLEVTPRGVALLGFTLAGPLASPSVIPVQWHPAVAGSSLLQGGLVGRGSPCDSFKFR